MPAVWHGTRAELHRQLALLPSVLAGHRSDPHGLGELFLKEVGREVLDLIYEAFLVKSRGGVGSDGISWAELKESTLERRRRKGITHDRRLEEHGDLLASLKPGEPGTVANQVFEIEPGAVTVGTSDPKSAKHQEGWGNVPARPIVPDALPPAWLGEIQAAMERGYEKVVERMCELGGVG
jgi:hypothetical protein